MLPKVYKYCCIQGCILNGTSSIILSYKHDKSFIQSEYSMPSDFLCSAVPHNLPMSLMLIFECLEWKYSAVALYASY